MAVVDPTADLLTLEYTRILYRDVRDGRDGRDGMDGRDGRDGRL